MQFPLAPVAFVSADRLTRGLPLLLYDGICSQTMATFGSIPFLVAIALSLQASTLVIGLVTALGPLTQVVQLPSIYLIERLGHRKLIVVATCVISRCCWILLAAVPLLIPPASVGSMRSGSPLLAATGAALDGRQRATRSLASINIATKLAPGGRSIPYFAVIGMITGAAAVTRRFPDGLEGQPGRGADLR